MKFLKDSDRAHLATLIARLVARDCPSSFILAILSLIDEESLAIVKEQLNEILHTTSHETVDKELIPLKEHELEGKSYRELLDWITRLQLTLSINSEKILTSLFLDKKNMDGTVLQLTTFVLQEFFSNWKREIAFEKLQPLGAGILQSIFAPHMKDLEKKALKEPQEGEEAEEEDSEEVAEEEKEAVTEATT